MEQKNALEKYFQPNASFEHPFCRVPSFSKFSMPLIGVINSRWVIWMIYRWYKILSPRIILDVHSLGKSGSPSWNTHERKQDLHANCTFCAGKSMNQSSKYFTPQSLRFSPFSSSPSTLPKSTWSLFCTCHMTQTVTSTILKASRICISLMSL